MKRLIMPLVPMLAITGAPSKAQMPCQLCVAEAPTAAKPAKPLKIDIETTLDFSTAAHTDIGSGSVTVDAATGARSFMGLVGAGGPALRGTVTITGEPFRRVIIELPPSIRLNSTMGAKADVTELQTNLPATALIGADGKLIFSFGGKLTVLDGAAGDFNGRVQVRANYQ